MGYNLGEQGESKEGFWLNRVRESVNRAIRTRSRFVSLVQVHSLC